MTTPTIRLLVLYPRVMDVYADRGNTIALQARCREYGIGCELLTVGPGEALPAEANLVLIGGGQDREQRRIAPELAEHAARLREWAEADVAFLAVCGGFQLFGRWYRTASGEQLPGVGLFDVVTVAPPAGEERCIGDVLANAAVEGLGELVGFENHAGRTYLGPAGRPLAHVEYGFGNNGDDGTEGAVYREAVGTYLHGPLLPKNMRLTDRLLRAALRHRTGGAADLPELPPGDRARDRARSAHRTAAAVARRRGRRPGPESG